MSSGTPDYYQTVRQVYGSAKCEYGGKYVNASADTILGTAGGKGVIYGGQISITGTGVQYGDSIKLYIDDEQISFGTFQQMNLYNVNKEHRSALYIIKYDDINYRYGLSLSHGITFDLSFELRYTEVHGRTPAVGWTVVYAVL